VEFPSKKEILLVQQSAVYEYERCQQINAMARQEAPPQQVDAGGMRMINNALWIPECAVELQLRLCVEAHCRSAENRAYEATLGAIKQYVAWTTMHKDVKVFVQNCLHCVATVPGDKVPRPLGTQPHATKPIEILHFDFLYIGLSRGGKYQYLLLLKDDLSGYLWLVPCRTADAAATVDALIRWFAVFGVVLLWMSDRGSHFKNEVWYNEYRRKSRPSIILLRQIARGRTELSSLHESKSYVLSVQCYQSLRCTQMSGPKWLTWFRAS
jgi:Integrase core domain/Integrase zinc binding domain